MGIFNSIGSVMGDAAYDAAKGEAIGRARDAAYDATHSAQEWRALAIVKQRYADALSMQVIDVNGRVRSLEGNLENLKEKEKELLANLDALQTRYPDIVIVQKKMVQEHSKNVKYGKQAKHRLEQMEKALRHSSADAASIKSFYEPYKSIVESLELESIMPPDRKEAAEEIWQKFVSGKKMTEDKKIEAILKDSEILMEEPIYYQMGIS